MSLRSVLVRKKAYSGEFGTDKLQENDRVHVAVRTGCGVIYETSCRNRIGDVEEKEIEGYVEDRVWEGQPRMYGFVKIDDTEDHPGCAAA